MTASSDMASEENFPAILRQLLKAPYLEKSKSNIRIKTDTLKLSEEDICGSIKCAFLPDNLSWLILSGVSNACLPSNCFIFYGDDENTSEDSLSFYGCQLSSKNAENAPKFQLKDPNNALKAIPSDLYRFLMILYINLDGSIKKPAAFKISENEWILFETNGKSPQKADKISNREIIRFERHC